MCVLLLLLLLLLFTLTVTHSFASLSNLGAYKKNELANLGHKQDIPKSKGELRAILAFDILEC